MTPTTTEQGFAQVVADRDNIIRGLLDEASALTKERDSIAACYEAREEEAHQLSERIIKLTKERDALALCVDQWRVDYHELRLERDALAAAGKLALDALNKHGSPYLGHIDEYQQGAEALRQAGLQ